MPRSEGVRPTDTPSWSAIRDFMDGREIGLPAAAALRRRGVEAPPDAVFRSPLNLEWGGQNHFVCSNDHEAAYRAAVGAGSPPEFAAFDRAARARKKSGGGVKVESDKGTAPATAVVGDQEGAAEERARILAGLPEGLIDPCDAVLRGGRALRLATLAALTGSEAWKNADTDLRLDVKARLESYVHAQLFERFLGRYDKRAEDWVDPLRVQADDGDEAPWASLDTLGGEAGKAWPSAASGLIFPGRVSLLSGKAKQGKSTLTAAAVAGIVTGADWLTGETQAPGDVLWIGAAGESQAAEVRDLVTDAGAQGDALARLHFMRARPAAAIKAALAKFPIANLRAVIVDSARGLMSTDGGDEDSSDDVRRTMTVIAELAEGDVGALAIHHMRRDEDIRVGNRTRGSGDWMAVVDVIAEFDRIDAGARLTYEGRRGGPSDPLNLTRTGGAFTVGRGGSTGGDTGGGGNVDVFAPGAQLAEFAQGWIMQHPEGTDRDYFKAARLAGCRGRNKTLLDARHKAQNAAAVAVNPEAQIGGPDSRDSTKPPGGESRESPSGIHAGFNSGFTGIHESRPIGDSRRDSPSGFTGSGFTGFTNPDHPDHPDRLRTGVVRVRRDWVALAAELPEPDRGEVLRAVVKLDWIPPGVDPRRHALDVLGSIPITPES